ncbi:MAG: hypothetical protein SFX18_08685 [Pirellulales bacterium]|nr:hypothetical protein [Pirellulales bacterium]
MIWLIIPVLTLHLVLVGVGSVGPLVAGIWELVAFFRKLAPAEATARLLVIRRLAGVSLAALSLGVGLGFLLWGVHAAFASDPDLSVSAAMTRLWGTRWASMLGTLGFSLACQLLALWLDARRHKEEMSFPGWGSAVLNLLAGANTTYHFPLLFVMFSTLITTANLANDPLTRDLYRTLLGRADVWGRVIHHWGAMLLSVGVTLLHMPQRLATAGPTGEMAALRALRSGSQLALAAILLQILTGLTNLLLLPTNWQNLYLGESPLAACLLVAGALGSFAVLPGLFELAFGGNSLNDATVRSARRLGSALLGVWLAMVAARQIAGTEVWRLLAG